MSDRTCYFRTNKGATYRVDTDADTRVTKLESVKADRYIRTTLVRMGKAAAIVPGVGVKGLRATFVPVHGSTGEPDPTGEYIKGIVYSV